MMDDPKDGVRDNNNARGEDVEVWSAEGYVRVKGSERDEQYSKNQYGENEGEDNDEDAAVEVVEEDEDDDDDDEDGNGVQRIGNSDVNDGHDMDGVEEENENEKSGYKRRITDIDFDSHPKKRRWKNLVSNYEFAPRVAQTLALVQPVADTDADTVAPTSAAPATTNKHFFGGRNALADWTEHETFVLLDAWGDRFLQHGRKSLRSEEWQEVAEKVSQESRIERTDTQCRNRLDTLKKKFKKEKAKFGPAAGQSSRWIYFKKMDMLMSPPVKQSGLSRGIESGEYGFSNPRGYRNRANGLDEMRESACHSDSTEDDSDGLPPRRKAPVRFIKNSSHAPEEKECRPMKLLADSLHSFCKIYEKMENSKRQQLVELEKMRMDFHRDLEQEKKLILERTLAEIAKIWQVENEENGGASGENISS